MRNAACIALVLALLAGCHGAHHEITPQEVIDSKIDLWGEAALTQPGGPSYEYFANLLPPLRYVDARFHHYPIALSAPTSLAKGRVLSNGSAINALARLPHWRNEMGTPWHVLIGQHRLPFGNDLAKLNGPHYAEGYLPIIQLEYAGEDGTYREECFAATDPKLAELGAIFVRFEFPAADRGRIDLEMEDGYEFLRDGVKQRRVELTDNRVAAAYDENWEWNIGRGGLVSREKHAASATVVIFTVPANGPVVAPMSEEVYRQQREQCARTWRDLVAAGTNVEVPEPYVNDAWRGLLVGSYMIVSGDDLNYSAGNQYARKYAHESGETMRSLLLFGHPDVAARGLPPIFKYRRPDIEFHDGGYKLEDLATYYFVTRDAELIRNTRDLWQREVDAIVNSRDPKTGMLPREKYCSDINTPVVSISANANCWRGIRDMSLILAEIGEKEQAEKLAKIAAEFGKNVLEMLEKSTIRTVDPPFVPIAIGEEEVHDPITDTRLGSYWNLVIPQLLFSGVFPANSQTAGDILRYIRTKGGMCMGMARVQSMRWAWLNVRNIDDLYTTRYALALLERDEADRALISFYGKLAQGMTRDTFIDGEASSIIETDRFGRQMGLPPNSTANASFLLQLRYLLVQDYDTDDDGRADTLRLAFATPRRWLEDGKKIVVEHAPTEFGEVAFTIESHLARGEVTAEIDLPPRMPAHALLRLRLPQGWRITSADAPTADETFDLSGKIAHVSVRAAVKRV